MALALEVRVQRLGAMSDLEQEVKAPARGMPSLRGRIALLAGTVIALLLITLGSLVWIVRGTEANAVSRSEKHLVVVARALADAYTTRSDPGLSLTTLPASGRPPGKDGMSPPLPPPPPPPPPAIPGTQNPSFLEELTAKLLKNETGIEGGFFRIADQQLLGYAFPTHEGPGDPRALPARETPDILRVASTSAAERVQQTDQFRGAHDVVLFAAVPVCESKACAGGPVGAAWLMQRLPGAEADRKRALLWSAFGFGATACITVLFAWFVLRQVGGGTAAVLDRLAGMETDLAHKHRPTNARLWEYQRILYGLDRLSGTLHGQIERERDLHVRLRQHERLAAIGQLAAGVAHELRNPLATIRLRAQMAQRKSTEQAIEQACSVILSEVDRLDGIIERLLEFTRPLRLQRDAVNLSAVAEAAVERWEGRSSGVQLRYTGSPGIFLVSDRLRWEQVLDNLLENAVHQLKEARVQDACIEVNAGIHAEGAVLTVTDNGGGFTEAALQRGTEPFFTTRPAGTGLGLAITQEIVHGMGGTLTLANRGDGASVRIQVDEERAR